MSPQSGKWSLALCSCVHALIMPCSCVDTGPIPWIMGAELFRQEPRPKAMAMVNVTMWISAFVIAMVFEPLQVNLYPCLFLSPRQFNRISCIRDPNQWTRITLGYSVECWPTADETNVYAMSDGATGVHNYYSLAPTKAGKDNDHSLYRLGLIY